MLSFHSGTHKLDFNLCNIIFVVVVVFIFLEDNPPSSSCPGFKSEWRRGSVFILFPRRRGGMIEASLVFSEKPLVGE
ncbi:hypothetical protein Tsubulata_033622 [Turnera subulata]|uniref:Uncharacterized protein n=1 Tax=Turnera subulata TaxID=218843 RepID=A0A9Q0F4Y8_9ROSI|nr:hypothetical protein Tsubulata_033622 [Turnera subulata]